MISLLVSDFRKSVWSVPSISVAVLVLGKKTNSFVHFLEESSAWKNHFDFVGPVNQIDHLPRSNKKESSPPRGSDSRPFIERFCFYFCGLRGGGQFLHSRRRFQRPWFTSSSSNIHWILWFFVSVSSLLIQSNLVIRNFLVTATLFLKVKCSLLPIVHY